MPPQCFAWEGGRRGVAQYIGACCVLLPLVTGCATVDQQASFSDVHAAVVARSGKRIVWNRDTALDAQVAEEVQTLLHSTLTADAAITAVLSGIQYDPPGTDTRTNAQINNEFFTVRNISSRPINLSGFRVLDAANHLFVFRAGTYCRAGRR